jgi:hypothetical protein
MIFSGSSSGSTGPIVSLIHIFAISGEGWLLTFVVPQQIITGSSFMDPNRFRNLVCTIFLVECVVLILSFPE